MDLVSSVWHIVSAATVFLAGLAISLVLAKKFEIPVKKSIALYIWHTIFCIIYAVYIIYAGGDAPTYYRDSMSADIEFSLGTRAIDILTRFYSTVMGLSYLGTFLAYNIFGFIGLLAFAASLRAATWDKSRKIRILASLIVFLPSVSFWSSAIGKDSFSFMAAGLALWAALDLGRRSVSMVVAVIVMLLVRPHIAGLMVIAVGASMAMRKKVSAKQRIVVGAVSLAGAAFLIPFALNYLGLGDATNSADLARYIEERQGYNMEGGGGVDIASMSLPMQLFTYLFRPLPFEAHSLAAFAASLDNVMLLFLFLFGGWEMIRRRKTIHEENRIFLWVYSLSSWFILAVTTANLGISVRQKWMFVPMLVFLFISVMGRSRYRDAAPLLSESENFDALIVAKVDCA